MLQVRTRIIFPLTSGSKKSPPAPDRILDCRVSKRACRSSSSSPTVLCPDASCLQTEICSKYCPELLRQDFYPVACSRCFAMQLLHSLPYRRGGKNRARKFQGTPTFYNHAHKQLRSTTWHQKGSLLYDRSQATWARGGFTFVLKKISGLRGGA